MSYCDYLIFVWSDSLLACKQTNDSLEVAMLILLTIAATSGLIFYVSETFEIIEHDLENY